MLPKEIKKIADSLDKLWTKQQETLEDIIDAINVNKKLLVERSTKEIAEIKEELQKLIKDTTSTNYINAESLYPTVDTINVNIDLSLDAQIPLYATEGSVGCDLCANIDGMVKDMFKGDGFRVINQTLEGAVQCITKVILSPGGHILIPTGIKLEIPEGYELQVRARSGLAIKHGITVLNGLGTIDSDYRGDVGVILINHSQSNDFTINHGDRIAQGVFNKVAIAKFTEVNAINETKRGSGGFGSTGIK